jgi:hypothetical protein
MAPAGGCRKPDTVRRIPTHLAAMSWTADGDVGKLKATPGENGFTRNFCQLTTKFKIDAARLRRSTRLTQLQRYLARLTLILGVALFHQHSPGNSANAAGLQQMFGGFGIIQWQRDQCGQQMGQCMKRRANDSRHPVKSAIQAATPRF